MIILQIVGVWCAAIVICAPVLIPVLVRRFHLNFRKETGDYEQRARSSSIRVLTRSKPA